MYYKGFLRTDKENKKILSLKYALDPVHVKAEAENILNTPGFKELTKLPEDRLRALAATKDAEKLLKQYVKESAKTMKQENDMAKPRPAKNGQNAPANPKVGK